MPAGTPTPFVVVNPRIYIAAADWSMSAAKAVLRPNSKKADIEVFTNPDGERESSRSWTLMIDFKQSYGADGSWNVLGALTDTLVSIELAPEDAAASPANPIATSSIWFPAIPFLDADVGGVTEWTLEEKTVGPPVFAVA